MFDASTVTITFNGSVVFTAEYTYSEADGIQIVGEWDSDVFTVEDCKLEYENGGIKFSIEIDDGEGPYNYSATLTK